MGFKEDNDIERRTRISSSIRDRYPERIPIICEPASDKLSIEKVKFLAPEDFKMGHFIFTMRKRIRKINSKEAVYVFVNGGTIPPSNKTLKDIYEMYKDDDGLLYLLVDKEKTFG